MHFLDHTVGVCCRRKKNRRATSLCLLFYFAELLILIVSFRVFLYLTNDWPGEADLQLMNSSNDRKVAGAAGANSPGTCFWTMREGSGTRILYQGGVQRDELDRM